MGPCQKGLSVVLNLTWPSSLPILAPPYLLYLSTLAHSPGMLSPFHYLPISGSARVLRPA